MTLVTSGHPSHPVTLPLLSTQHCLATVFLLCFQRYMSFILRVILVLLSYVSLLLATGFVLVCGPSHPVRSSISRMPTWSERGGINSDLQGGKSVSQGRCVLLCLGSLCRPRLAGWRESIVELTGGEDAKGKGKGVWRLPVLSTYWAHTMLLPTISIMAVDF